MPLRIFVSSVSAEFDAERKALEREIQQLGELYEGMEYFGSDPRNAISFDNAAIGRADLYVGLLGDRFGSIAGESRKSFTELEYDAARGREIPTLVYFKDAFLTGAEESEQLAFKQRVRAEQLGAVFKSVHELEIQFLIDLFKQIRGPLFAKLGPHLGAIPFDALHAITRDLLPERIRIVARDKYIQEVYVHRPAERSIQEFVDFEETFTARADKILETLKTIADAYLIGDSAASAIIEVKHAIFRSHDRRGLERAIAMLKQAYHFNKIEEDFAMLASIDRRSGAARTQKQLDDISVQFRSRSYLDRTSLDELIAVISREARGRLSGGADSPG
jgi:hypothetical protein